MARSKAPFIVISGSEEFYIDREIEKFKRNDKVQVILLDGPDCSGSDVVDACESRTLDGRSRVVVLDNAGDIKSDKESLKGYIEATDELSEALLVAVVRSDKVPEPWQKAASKGKSQVFKKLPPWDTKGREDQIEAEAHLLGVKLDKKVAATLLSAIGPDLYVIRNELAKLSLLTRQVTVEHLKLVLTAQPPAAPHEVADAAVEKNPKRALNLVAHLYRYMGDGASVPIVFALMRSVERLLVVRSMLDGGKPTDAIASHLNMNSYHLQKTFLLWANRHTVKDLKRHLAMLCQLDADVKGPARSKRTLVELAVQAIAA